MDKSLIRVMLIIIFIEACVLVTVFNQNLPHWCANPTGQGNSIILPLCK